MMLIVEMAVLVLDRLVRVFSLVLLATPAEAAASRVTPFFKPGGRGSVQLSWTRGYDLSGSIRRVSRCWRAD
jgi:hypothetical protein